MVLHMQYPPFQRLKLRTVDFQARNDFLKVLIGIKHFEHGQTLQSGETALLQEVAQGDRFHVMIILQMERMHAGALSIW